ncbi:hypothetical protein [Streptomyces naphthomycinicus]|uniref:hypothetical protein n=1 Tax=Streptomyces naphthomycinicus TaxID=2872625 RepID=UPI001CED3C03|nr:hypothetical protein [Streptomyces sp. TML10]
MRAQRIKRLFVASAAGALLTGGAAIGAAGSASAVTPAHDYSCSYYTDGCGHWWRGDCGGYGYGGYGWDDGGYGGYGHGDYGYGGYGHGGYDHDDYGHGGYGHGDGDWDDY